MVKKKERQGPHDISHTSRGGQACSPPHLGASHKVGEGRDPRYWLGLYLCFELVEEITLVSLPTQVLPD